MPPCISLYYREGYIYGLYIYSLLDGGCEEEKRSQRNVYMKKDDDNVGVPLEK
jgi:hypothetical protein